MTSSRTFSPLRRTMSLALVAVALCLIAIVFAPISSLEATAANAGGASESTAENSNVAEPAQLDAFRQAIGGAVTPLIIELKKDPVALRKHAEEQAGGQMSFEDVVAYTRELLTEQNELANQLASRGVRALLRETNVKQIDGAARTIHYRFTYVLNGFVAYVADADIDKLKALPEVAHVSEPLRADFHLDRAIDYSLGTQTNPADRRTAVYGANQEFQPAGSPGHPETPFSTKIDGFEGQNMNIAIIDSGVDYRHPMFGGIGQTTPLPRVSGRPESADDNRKVIYFYAFSEPVGDPTDDFGHGTLVASNAAGFLVDGNTAPRAGYGLGFDGRGVGPTPDGRQLFGTAPQARILAYKVCGPAPQCAGDIELSIEDAASPVTLTGVGDGASVPTMVPKPVADIINLSLGDTSGNPAGASSRAANNAALAGTLVVASAGNSGVPGSAGDGTIGAPSAATLAISVAASLDPGSVAGSDVLAPGSVPLETRTPATPGPSPEMGATSNANAPQPGERQGMRIFPVAGGGTLPTEQNPGEPALNTGSLSAHYAFVDFARNAAVTANVPSTVTNRIALVKRNEADPARPPFAAITNAIAPLRPAAIVIITSIESATAVVVAGGIPAFTIGLDDGEYLIDRALSGDPGDGDPNIDVPNGTISELPLRLADSISLPAFTGFMAGFSSRGPNDHPNANFRTIKPDVTAPGVGIVGAATVEGLPDETIGLSSTTGYTQANGTSFSGPITAGAVTLVRQRVREELGLDATDVKDPDFRAKRFNALTVARALLQNSATNLRNGLGQPQGNGAASVASINEMGSGHINVAEALRAEAIMVSPTVLFRNPPEFGNPDPVSGANSGDNIIVEIPTASFGAVPVVGLDGRIERRKEVIIRDVTNGKGGGTYALTGQNNRLATSDGFEVSFVNANGVPINSVNVPQRGQRSFFVRVVADGRQITEPNTEFQFYVTATDATGDRMRMPFYYRAVAADPNAIPGTAAQLRNISTRVSVQTGENVGIAGIIITGDEPKRVALRGIGPSLQANDAPLNGRLDDPVLELFDGSGALIVSNDNWKDTQQDRIEDSGFAPGDERESVILRTLAPGNYTAVLRGKDNGTGIGLVEAYDRDETGDGRFANISTRGRVETGDNVLIGGFIAGRQDGPTNIVVRALGPSLVTRGVPQALQDPTVQLVNQNGDVINENDDFALSPQRSEIESRGLAPQDAREAALFQPVQPGNYTAVVRGKLDTTGVGLVEVYNVR